MLKMAPTTQTTPSKAKAKDPIDETNRLTRGLTKLSTAFTSDLSSFKDLRLKCEGAVNGITPNPAYQTHQNILCEYITSAVRGTYGNRQSDPGSGVQVFSGLGRTERCYILRICMKYLIKNYCLQENDITTILNAMESKVRSWAVGGNKKNKEYFDKCIKKSWGEEKGAEKNLKCRVIEVIKASDRGSSSKLDPLRTLSGGGSGTCPMNYDHGCINGTAGSVVVDDDDSDVDSEESEDDDDDEDDNDGAVTAATTTTPTQSTSHSSGHGIGSFSPSLPPGNGNGKKGKVPFPSLSSFPFDSIHPYLPLVPSILGIITITYFLWKYFGQLGKIKRFRRAPLRIPGPSVQEQVLDHVQQDSSHEYRLVKERKPRSAPTRTKRSGPVNRRTIIEIHFEVLDECQKGDTQLNQKDFLELLVQEFMGSELMEEKQVPKDEVLMECVPLERVPIEEVPSLGSVFMV
ncbi:SICAvar, type II [Plasmodium knowlesi strain H]|nr:SICAvar, type II [Plasmodium knowlesi strain H]SBO29200.1 SICAvar, type II [Plasmodium knowlesi strain H]